jgi:predicted DNA-binding protein (MmcQ/YjbR family)
MVRTKQGDDGLIERLRKICLALPEANERVSHGEPTWFAGRGKVFAMLDNHHHGAPHLSVWLPLRHGEQARLIEEDPERYFRPPYTGPKGWVGVVLDTRPDWKLVAGLVRDAYEFVASRQLVAALGTAAHPAAGVALEASSPKTKTARKKVRHRPQ